VGQVQVTQVAACGIENPDKGPLSSAASLWEVAIKRGLGRRDFSPDPPLLRRELLGHGYEELAVSGDHAVGVVGLPPIHKDPFDRVLIAQAIAEGIVLLTVDDLVAQYPGPIRRV
jgi:PIN domain nuclease of toxin-antitoxin system